MMTKNEIIAEAILLSTYCDIIIEILCQHEQLSINKMMFFSYIAKKERFNQKAIYDAKNSSDVILKVTSQLSGSFDDYCNNIRYILQAINLLIKSNNIELENGNLYLVKKQQKSVYQVSNFTKKCIIESDKMTERQFLKEVIHNV